MVIGTNLTYSCDVRAAKLRRPTQWPCRVKRGSAAARLLGLRVRITPGAWMSLVSVVGVVR